ncbi:cytochrome c biogenesis protein ResB [Bacillus thermotolerans]|uniref:Cytochrome c-type biogenesis protein Ccs1/ResB n=1 Tax=Bacillus thermotolerans TaxID=1221996 RepID=A0A0F5HYV6_BACTR|nr:cytochrome c biogenesis protein ResB [Bacillus thermotolerans]KKB35609.1 Cytochrome c-type biogenesis protein Ccs1/ResB [Bacillus thermotolerans]KKB37929.1 Cytochrome c-type biogenesis protein Ccs1/ResB [Bacillus thermotolerans]KKB38413.1 Cytochrome c-type biogenesis protein Ccs1/ResB [Bacillus thermotolerans]
MGKVKCECGHVNPHGTVLCESCGRALTEEAKKEKFHDMRYEGSARRSQTYNKTIVDKVWNFFSSVKVGVWLIVLTLIASSLGTIFPQEFYIPNNVTADTYYEDTYGIAGKIYYMLGFHDLYNSIWFIALVASIGVSLVICSLDRVIPLHRALKNQRVARHTTFMKKQRLFASREGTIEPQEIGKVKESLKESRYHIREEDGSLLAEKGRFSRWGPYVNHIGLIIFLIGAMLRSVEGMYVDELLWIREGETLEIPGTDGEYYLKNEQFIMENYDKEKDSEVFSEAIEENGVIAKNYQTDAILYRDENRDLPGAEPELVEVKKEDIRVNEPMKFDQFALYQNGFSQNEMKAMEFMLTNKETQEAVGAVKIDLFNPKDVYDLGNGYKVELLGYYPDYDGIGKDGEPKTKSPVPNNPAFLFNLVSPEHPDGEVAFTAIRQTMEPMGETDYKMEFSNIETRDISALTVRKDLTLWILALGGTIFMIGVIQGSFWAHRRLWIRQVDGKVYVAAHTNKNWHGLQRELDSIIEHTSIPSPEDQQASEQSGKEKN